MNDSNVKDSLKRKLEAGHKKPVTRRDFISQGLIGAGGYILAPTALTLLFRSEEARAALNCTTSGTPAGFVPFLGIDCSGGAALSGNAVVGSQTSGSLVQLASYNTLGIPYAPASTPGSIDAQFGLPFHTGPAPVDATKPISKIYEAILASTSATTRANTRMVGIAHFSQDDSRDNELCPLIAITQAGLRGTLLQNGMGTESSLSGANSATSLANAEYKPLYVSRVETIVDALSYGSTLNAYPPAYKAALAKSLSTMSQAQATRFASMSLGEQFQNLVNCGFISNERFATTAPDIDPRKNASMMAVYGLTATTSNRDSQVAGIVYNAITGTSGGGVITIGGCDYHDESRLPDNTGHGDFKDLEIGKEIGRALESAARLNKPLFIGVWSDGALSSVNGTRIWSSDSGSRGLSIMIYYNPAGARTNRNSQLGAFTSGQTISNTPFFSGNQKFVSYIMLANYLSVSGQLGLFSSLAPTAFPVDTNTINSIIGFG